MSPMSWYAAGKVCWKYDQHLVTIHSQNELRYINYILRDQMYKDGINHGVAHTNDLSYTAHIGESTLLQMVSIKFWVLNV